MPPKPPAKRSHPSEQQPNDPLPKKVRIDELVEPGELEKAMQLG